MRRKQTHHEHQRIRHRNARGDGLIASDEEYLLGQGGRGLGQAACEIVGGKL